MKTNYLPPRKLFQIFCYHYLSLKTSLYTITSEQHLPQSDSSFHGLSYHSCHPVHPIDTGHTHFTQAISI